MKTPIAYYGGKQAIVKHLLDLVPRHEVYTECFMGGGTLFWAKRPEKNETINDTSDLVVNFYQELRSNYAPLKKLIDQSLMSRSLHNKALFMIRNKEHFEKTQLAWAFWLTTNFSFMNKIGGGYKYSNVTDTPAPRTLHKKKADFTELLVSRIENASIENEDAIKVLMSRNVANAFHYLDPPYPGTDQGPYKGYGFDDLQNLLDACCNLKGKFLLSNYNSPLLDGYIKQNGWNKKEIKIRLKTNRRNSDEKSEVLVWNYEVKRDLFSK